MRFVVNKIIGIAKLYFQVLGAKRGSGDAAKRNVTAESKNQQKEKN